MKETILQAIRKVKDIIEYRIKSEFLSEDYMPIYMFTTENIKAVINYRHRPIENL